MCMTVCSFYVKEVNNALFIELLKVCKRPESPGLCSLMVSMFYLLV